MSAETPIWAPSEDVLARSQLTRLIERLGVAGYDELYRLSVEDPARFWAATLDLLEIRFATPYERFVSFEDGLERPQWFVGGRLNAASLALRRGREPASRDREAVVYEDESGAIVSRTYGELADAVAELSAGLRAAGVEAGDRVGLFLTMSLDAVVALLAVASIGAVGVPLFSGFGVEAAASRLSLAGATALVAVESFVRRGRTVDLLPTIGELATAVPTLRTAVIRRTTARALPELGVDWNDLAGRGRLEPVPVSAGHPLLILFTSGTTGKPKGVVHTHGGFPLKVIQDSAHVFDVAPGDRLFWPTDLGWVLGALTIYGVLGNGATLVLYDGALDVPTWDRFTDVARRHRVTHLGASPTLIRTLAAHGTQPGGAWSALRILLAAGEVLDPEHFVWYASALGGGKLPVINYSGGTEVSGGLVANVVHRPINPARFNSAVPGVDLAVFDDGGRPAPASTGELVILRPCVGMADGFWAAPEQFHDTYWSRYPGVWAHGDLAESAPDGSFRIVGRADDTLKIAGKRTGPAEIESVALEDEGVREAAAIGIPDPIRGESLILLVVAQDPDGDVELLEERIRNAVADKLGRPFVPHRLHVVSELPRTRTGKIMRRLARNAYLGVEDVGDTSALENPSSLQTVRSAGETATAASAV